MGLEPTTQPWKGRMLPLHQWRILRMIWVLTTAWSIDFDFINRIAHIHIIKTVAISYLVKGIEP